ncbi:hypothetical protein SDC9_35465 [bioreactor metagenome]|uniref:Uncharacterized protein n=1 Tax=bioreactor metagenome TaxID=1076179 RepID=A0A644VDR2_9ZZZZ
MVGVFARKSGSTERSNADGVRSYSSSTNLPVCDFIVWSATFSTATVVTTDSASARSALPAGTILSAKYGRPLKYFS